MDEKGKESFPLIRIHPSADGFSSTHPSISKCFQNCLSLVVFITHQLVVTSLLQLWPFIELCRLPFRIRPSRSSSLLQFLLFSAFAICLHALPSHLKHQE